MHCVYNMSSILLKLIFFITLDALLSKNPVEFAHFKRKTFPKNHGTMEEMLKRLGPERPSSQLAFDGVWQPVFGTVNAFYVYSAYLDLRTRPAVRVIAATRREYMDGVFCRLWQGNTGYVLRAEIELIGENHNRYHSAVFVLCLLNQLTKEAVGGEISVVSVTAREKVASNLLKVMDITPKNSGKTNLHICVRPLHGYHNDVEWMVEWIELNRILGVSHFYFYNMSLGDRFDCMLQKYPNHEELFTILSFQLPITDLWMQGQLASSQDCLYRSMSKADWLMPVDIDEVIIPHNIGIQMLHQYYGRQVIPYPAIFEMLTADSDMNCQFAIIFRNAFFYLGFADDPQALVPLKTSKKTRRLEMMHWYGVRSKYVVRPSKAVALSVHKVQKFVIDHNSSNIYVDSRIARLHHYKEECAVDQFMCLEDYPSVIDRAAHRWSKRLWRKVQDRLGEIKQVCP